MERYISEKLPFFRTLPCIVVANVAGESGDEYEAIVSRLENEEVVWGFEINLSCPNVENWLAIGTDPGDVAA